MAPRRRPLPLSLAVAMAAASLSSVAAADTGDAFTEALARGPAYAGFAAFASGFLVSLTPCVYPMVAITVSVFGARQVESKLKGALLSAAFVAGIVAMFVPLGVAAGLTGSLAGAVLQSPWVVVGLCGLFFAMAAAMFGAFELDIPSGLKNRLAQIGGTGYLGAFLLGLACGPIAAPCTGPFLTGILAWIARTQSAGLGALAMGAFALGLGVPFFVVGTFAVQLPKGGSWMAHVKSVLGIVLLIVAFYTLNNTFGVLSGVARPTAVILSVSGGLAIAGLLLGAVHKSFDGLLGDRVRKGVGIALTSLCGTLFLVAAAAPAQSLVWQHVPATQARARALADERPLIVDFGAAWCVACKELDKITFAREDVRAEAGRFVAVKVDATNDDDPAVEAVLSAFQVRGLPTVVVFDSKGNEALRYTDFVGPDQFLRAIKQVN